MSHIFLAVDEFGNAQTERFRIRRRSTQRGGFQEMLEAESMVYVRLGLTRIAYQAK